MQPTLALRMVQVDGRLTWDRIMDHVAELLYRSRVERDLQRTVERPVFVEPEIELAVTLERPVIVAAYDIPRDTYAEQTTRLQLQDMLDHYALSLAQERGAIDASYQENHHRRDWQPDPEYAVESVAKISAYEAIITVLHAMMAALLNGGYNAFIDAVIDQGTALERMVSHQSDAYNQMRDGMIDHAADEIAEKFMGWN